MTLDTGTRYLVLVDDCCVSLRFTATLLKIDAWTGDYAPDGSLDLWDEDQFALEFDNGVIIPGGPRRAVTIIVATEQDERPPADRTEHLQAWSGTRLTDPRDHDTVEVWTFPVIVTDGPGVEGPL